MWPLHWPPNTPMPFLGLPTTFIFGVEYALLILVLCFHIYFSPHTKVLFIFFGCTHCLWKFMAQWLNHLLRAPWPPSQSQPFLHPWPTNMELGPAPLWPQGHPFRSSVPQLLPHRPLKGQGQQGPLEPQVTTLAWLRAALSEDLHLPAAVQGHLEWGNAWSSLSNW